MRTTLYLAEWVMPVAAAPIPAGAVLVDGRGIIAAVGPREVLQVGDDVARVDLGRAVLLPGLVNVHAHPELTAMRGLLEDLPFHQWIPTLRRTKDRARLEAADFGVSARWACAEAIAAGITTMGATEDSGASLDAFREAGLRGTVYREVFGPAAQDAASAFVGLRERVERMRRMETDLVRTGVSPHAPYTVSDELFRLTAAFATAESLPIAVHIAESEVESRLVEDGDGAFAAGLRTRGIETPRRAGSPITLLERTGVLAARPLLIHCVRLGPGDIGRIADAGASVAHCPIANARLGHGIAPVLELLEAGVTVGLGTDSVASNNRMDMLEEGRAAQLMQRAQQRSSGALPPALLLRMATLDGARALGIEARTGSLEVGKDADLCALRMDSVHTAPVHDPAAALVLSARAADVVLTAVRGSVLYRDGKFLTVDPERLRSRLEDVALRLRTAREAG